MALLNETKKKISIQRFDNVEVVRGLASVAVVFYHFTYFLQDGNPLKQFCGYGYLGVDCFFVISGFVLPLSFFQKNYSLRDAPLQFLKRAWRIEIPYWACIALMAIKDAGEQWYADRYHFKMPATYSTKSLLVHAIHANTWFGMPFIRDLFWTLALDWQFYLFLLIAFFLIKQRAWFLRYPLYVALAATRWLDTPNWAMYYVFAFLAGIMFFHYTVKFISTYELLSCWLLLSYFADEKMWLPHTLAIFSACAILFFVQHAAKPFLFLGKISYALYLTHTFSGWTLVSSYLKYNPNASEWDKTLYVVVSVFLCIPFAYLFYKYIEETAQRYSKLVFNYLTL